MDKRDFWSGVIFVFLVATVSHLLFSSLGFNPTDDGWVLAGSRRIIEGQVPHRDFIFLRASLSLFIHAPFVLFGGDYVFLISRYFVWIEFAAIAWIWMLVITRSFQVFSGVLEKFVIALITFFFSVYFFPIMAWYTIDGLLFASLGILLCDRNSKILGYLLVGISPLCKQNFMFMIPVTILLFKDWRQIRFWIVSMTPIMVFGSYLLINSALSDAILQISIHTNIYSLGIAPYIYRVATARLDLIYFPLQKYIGFITLFGLIAGCVLALLTDFFKWLLCKWFGVLILNGLVVGTAVSMSLHLYRHTPFGIFGIAGGVIIYLIAKEKVLSNYLRAGLLAIFLAWCTSLSLGYNTPALVAGPLIIFPISFMAHSFRDSKIHWVSLRMLKRMVSGLVIVSLVGGLLAFGIVRTTHIYRDQPAAQLTYDLGDVLPGAKGIKTNENTYYYFVDLQVAKSIVEERGKRYCIIPDTACNWIKDSQSNPLPTDWADNYNFASEETLNRGITILEESRGQIVIIVQKYEAKALANGFIPLADDYEIVNYVQSNFNKVGETQYFELYE